MSTERGPRHESLVDRQAAATPTSRAWAPWAMASGGVLMAAVWLVFTSLHGPTSFNEGRRALGHDMHAWGLVLGVGPNVLIAAALLAMRARLTSGGSRLAAGGFTTVVFFLVASAVMDLAFLSLGPPLFMPLVGMGAVSLSLGLRDRTLVSSATRWTIGILGLVLLVAAALSWAPREWSDSVGGYRIFGAIGYLGAGLLWAGVAATLAIKIAGTNAVAGGARSS